MGLKNRKSQFCAKPLVLVEEEQGACGMTHHGADVVGRPEHHPRQAAHTGEERLQIFQGQPRNLEQDLCKEQS